MIDPVVCSCLGAEPERRIVKNDVMNEVKRILLLLALFVFLPLRSGNKSLDLEMLNNAPAISAYDELFRRVGSEVGADWRLLSAIAYHESRFTADIVSRRGARGLMQIMPSVARHFDVPQERLLDPETNVRLANQLLNEIARTMRFSSGASDADRLSIVLAGYNSGVGHVADARRLARAYGENPDSWAVVSRYLELKSAPEYYNHEVVRSGRFSGYRQTLAYVSDVMERYDSYCRQVER